MGQEEAGVRGLCSKMKGNPAALNGGLLAPEGPGVGQPSVQVARVAGGPCQARADPGGGRWAVGAGGGRGGTRKGSYGWSLRKCSSRSPPRPHPPPHHPPLRPPPTPRAKLCRLGRPPPSFRALARCPLVRSCRRPPPPRRRVGDGLTELPSGEPYAHRRGPSVGLPLVPRLVPPW